MKIPIIICALLLSCNNQQVEKQFFFKGPRGNRVERMRKYSLQDQFRIFRYGVDKIEPPDLELANPIAERGVTVVPFLMQQLRLTKDDLAIRDILLILRTMLRFKTYAVNRDAALMNALQERIVTMKDLRWKSFCEEIFEDIKYAP